MDPKDYTGDSRRPANGLTPEQRFRLAKDRQERNGNVAAFWVVIVVPFLVAIVLAWSSWSLFPFLIDLARTIKGS